MMILTMDLAALVDSYSIDYFDCRMPKGISRYDVSQVCEEERMNDPAKQTYYLLQKHEIKKKKGHSCSIIKFLSTILWSMEPSEVCRSAKNRNYTGGNKIGMSNYGTESILPNS